MTKDEALNLALEALEEIALAGMSPAPEMIDSKEAFHARQAWRFIGVAARALDPIKEALAQPVIDKSAATRIATSLGWEPKRKPLSEERIDDIWNLHCDEMGYVSVSDAVELARDFEAAHGIKE